MGNIHKAIPEIGAWTRGLLRTVSYIVMGIHEASYIIHIGKVTGTFYYTSCGKCILPLDPIQLPSATMKIERRKVDVTVIVTNPPERENL